MKALTTVILVTIATLLTGCLSGREFISVEEKFSKGQTVTGFHLVERGETLFSIAWRYGIDYRELASANSIASPYVIYPGQKIDIRNITKRSSSPVVASVENPSKPLPKTQSPAKLPKKTSHNPPKISANNADTDWKWPVNGRLIGHFSTKKPVNKGIDIAGALGESVLAAAAGTVVYAGQGLRGYGNLVIVKHNDTYLSAYAHTSRILVSEQEVVKAGQKIAEIGSTGTDKVKLHFEIRRNGKPVDPLRYLPSRPG
ncbi:MAG: peptidase M23 [Thalassobium sp.]|uniref:Peptidoglycan DD-metalloendopeptidase family protein n=1 Tax=Thalassolituus pacificus TaxID=2975440 RepID=A0A9X2WDB1_9GAMM|nr:peptidoglycan DD-metalloendopeptidase family protein [Thalassolituus pacificus]MCT7358311.1 peptidoglycan DD-metalloendopeptidase family protein [Thalassolituus pacificus]PHS63890.1 MAG: peptidase M23 [Thalassobium sp.]